jgi:hypothetical protein
VFPGVVPLGVVAAMRDTQPNKGMVKDYARSMAAMLKEYRVYSWWQGQWWLVDHGTDRNAMVASAAQRQAFVTGPRLHPRTLAVVGPPINSAGRFTVCVPGVLPN